MSDKEKPNPRIVRLEAKIQAAQTPLQKASRQRQLAVILAGDDTKAVAQVNADYMTFKTEVFAVAAKAKAAAKARAKAKAEGQAA